MEIQERLYSVVMTEEEVALFSEFQEMMYSEKDSKGKTAAKIALGTSGAAVGTVLGAKYAGKLLEDGAEKLKTKEMKKLWEEGASLTNNPEKLRNMGKKLQMPADKIMKLVKKIKK